MPSFNKNESQKLKEFLYNSCFHDANIESIRYDCKKKELSIEAFNPIFDIRIKFVFSDVKLSFSIKGDCDEARETILSLTLEEDFSYLYKYFHKKEEEYTEDVLYLLFQMFSGDELHILSEKVTVEILENTL